MRTRYSKVEEVRAKMAEACKGRQEHQTLVLTGRAAHSGAKVTRVQGSRYVFSSKVLFDIAFSHGTEP